MTDTAIPATTAPSSFAVLPIGLFCLVMGLTGLSIAWRLARARYDAPPWIAETIGVIALLAFVLLVIGHAAMAVTAPAPHRAR